MPATCSSWRRPASALLLAWFLVAPATELSAQHWPQWRGPAGTSVSSDRKVPVNWNSQRAIVWKSELPAWGNSTPAVFGNAIFVTSHTEDGQLLLTAIHRAKGQVAWQREVGRGFAARQAPKRSRQKFHQLHNLASPSPVTNGEVVVAHFGNGDLAAYDYQGNRLWHRNLAADHGDYTIWWGHANSPVIYQDMVISACMQDSLQGVTDTTVDSYVVAHDLNTGREIWKTLRNTGADAEECDAYTTPLLIHCDGREQLLLMGGNVLNAYDPRLGKELWHVSGLVGGRTVTGPTFADGVAYAARGMRGPLVAVRCGGSGELPNEATLWEYDQGTPDSCCPVVINGLLFMVSDDGIARCLNVNNGKLQWKERLKGKYKASPVAIHGRVFFLNTTGLCTVVSASSRYERVAENQIEDDTLASPAVSNGQIFLRGKKYLWCIGRR